ncbi:MAG: type 1 glutamine amidotransferase [Verrucomicrobiota bacterium]
MRLHYLQHVHFENMAYIEQWAKHENFTITCTEMFNNAKLPHIDSFEWLVIMGGPMNIYEYEQYPWLADEAHFIKQAIDKGKKVLGICLGAQLIAHALGAKVSQNKHHEIGWFPVERTKDYYQREYDLPPLPKKMTFYHWHGDTFSIPNKAIPLAASKACKNQAFFYPPKTLALQFHPESTEESVHKLMESCGNDLPTDKPFVQSKKTMGNDCKTYVAEANELMKDILNWMNQLES